MLVFAAVVPHTPILLPQIGKQNRKRLNKTLTALDILQDEFTKAAPDIVVVLSPHGDIFPDAYTINMLPEYQGSLHEFGDFETTYTYSGALSFIARFKEQVETTQPLSLQSHEALDYSISVPLSFLATSYKDFKIVPLHNSLLGLQHHVDFGYALREAISQSNRRVALIASAELSHRLLPKGPHGFSPRAKEFDKKVIQLLKQKKTDNIVSLDKSLIDDAAPCGLRTLMIMQGVLEGVNYDFQVLSYESPFGTGHLVAEYKLY